MARLHHHKVRIVYYSHFSLNDGIHVKKYSTEKYNIFAWFTDQKDDDESSESEGEDGKELEGIFDDVPLDNSDIQ